MKQVAQKTHELILEAPVEIGQVIVNNIISHDVNLVATRMVRKKGENV
jgi:CxxC motif-containing protein